MGGNDRTPEDAWRQGEGDRRKATDRKIAGNAETQKSAEERRRAQKSAEERRRDRAYELLAGED
jgi:hypothetical protein